jgi:hypothetical protein
VPTFAVKEAPLITFVEVLGCAFCHLNNNAPCRIALYLSLTTIPYGALRSSSRSWSSRFHEIQPLLYNANWASRRFISPRVHARLIPSQLIPVEVNNVGGGLQIKRQTIPEVYATRRRYHHRHPHLLGGR